MTILCQVERKTLTQSIDQYDGDV